MELRQARCKKFLSLKVCEWLRERKRGSAKLPKMAYSVEMSNVEILGRITTDFQPLNRFRSAILGVFDKPLFLRYSTAKDPSAELAKSRRLISA
jgi:hypothetical protein